MSKTTRIDAYQTVLKPGVYQSGNTRGGLNLNKWIPKFLKKIGFADTSDPLCCQYFPTVPTIEVANFSVPTGEEMDAAGVPVYGMFKTISGNYYYIFVREPEDGVSVIATND